LPDFFNHRHLSRQKNPVIQGTSCDFRSAARAGCVADKNSVEVLLRR
jgi:hypothetical protein